MSGATAGLDRSTRVGQRGAMGFPNPSITGTAIVKALDPNQATAHHQDADEAQGTLDAADLREEERAAYYGDAAAAPLPTDTAPRGSWIIGSCGCKASLASAPRRGIREMGRRLTRDP